MWYYSDNDQEIGPLDEEALFELAASGKITADTYLYREGWENWMPAGRTELFAWLGTPADEDESNELEELRAEIARLKGQLAGTSGTHSGSTSIEGLETFTLRIGQDDIIHYANTPFCNHFKLTKDEIINKPVSELKRILDDAFLKAFDRPESGTEETTVRDRSGKVYEVRRTLREGLLDVVIQDVTNEQRFKDYVKKYVSADLAELSEDDLDTFKYPERRFMSVSFTDLRGFTAMSETLSPEDVRSTMNAYLDATIRAVEDNKATVDKIVGDEVMALYGAPRYYKDHALRAIVSACDQIRNLAQLQTEFRRIGKEMPHCGIGVNTGDMVVGNMGGGGRQDYTVLGAVVNLAARLCGAARGGEIVTTEATLNAVLETLPEGWNAQEFHSVAPVDISGIGGKTEVITQLPEHLAGKLIAIGPALNTDGATAQFSFQYAYAAKVKGVDEPLPVLLVHDYRQADASMALSEDLADRSQAERIFGKYRFIERIGRGGMGEVWKAKDSFGNVVAVKLLIAGEGASESQIKRFKREAEIMAKLQHPGICRIHEVGEVDKINYIAMEYVDGVTLSAILKHRSQSTTRTHGSSEDLDSLVTIVKESIVQSGEQEGGNAADDNTPEADQRNYTVLPFQQTLSLISKVCQAVHYAHEHGILHRDLKPANIMIRSDGSPVVMDFGLAKMDTSDQGEASLSVSGQIVGTIEYMSPEQAESSKAVRETADVYSLGAILYQMLTGKRHFASSGNLLTDANNLKFHMPVPLRKHNSEIDRDLEIITLKALRPEAVDRYPSVNGLREDLLKYRNGEVISARSVSIVEMAWKWCKRNKALSSVVALSLVILISSAVWFVISLNQKRLEAEASEARAMEAKDEADQARAAAEEARKTAEEARLVAEQKQREADQKAEELEAAFQRIMQTETRLSEALEKGDLTAAALQRLRSESQQREQARELSFMASELFYNLKIDEAERELEEAIRIEPDSSLAWLLKAQLALVRLSLPEVHDAGEKVLEFDPGKREIINRLYRTVAGIERMGDPASFNPIQLVEISNLLKGYGEYMPFIVAQDVFDKLADYYLNEREREAYRLLVMGYQAPEPKIRSMAAEGLQKVYEGVNTTEKADMTLSEELDGLFNPEALPIEDIYDLQLLVKLSRKVEGQVLSRVVQQAGRTAADGGLWGIQQFINDTSSGDDLLRKAPFFVLARRVVQENDDNAFDTLIRSLEEDSELMRYGAAQGFGFCLAGDGNDMAYLMMSTFATDDNERIRYYACHALALGAKGFPGRPGNDDAVSALATIAGSDPSAAEFAMSELKWLAEQGVESAKPFVENPPRPMPSF